MNRSTRHYFRICAVVIGVGIGGSAHADLQQELDGMFNGMVNVTDPRAFETQRRGVLSGGSIFIRAPVVRPKLMSFVPPSVNAGCNGLDVFGGSFSFIRKEEFTQFLRAIAGNAESYFFGMALKSICPTCMDEMSRLQTMVQDMNARVKDSCTTAKALVAKASKTDLTDDEKHEMSESAIMGPVAKRVGGVLDDYEQFFKPPSSSTQTNKGAANSVDPEIALREKLIGNVTWRVLYDADIDGVKSWFQFGDHDLNLVLLSMVGTTIISDHPERPDDDYAFTNLPPIFGLDGLLTGTMTDANGVSRYVEVYNCPEAANVDELIASKANACMPVVGKGQNFPRKDLPGFRGFYPRVRQLLIGDNETGAPGMVQKYARNMAGGFSDEEKAFAQTAPPNVMAYIRDLATTSEVQAIVFAEEASKTLALELARSVMTELIMALRMAGAGQDHPQIGDFLRNVDEAGQKFQSDYALEASKLQQTTNLAGFFDSLRRQARGKSPVVLAPVPGNVR